MISAFAETNRAPFDLPEAEAELVAGFHTEYSSMKLAMFFLGEYMNMIAISRDRGDAVPGRLGRAVAAASRCMGSLWFFAKLFAVLLFFFIWVRWTFPRLRYDQLMAFGWKVLLPVALAERAGRPRLVVYWVGRTDDPAPVPWRFAALLVGCRA